ncbi:MAG: enoyl-CoA hydratase-related protein [Thermaerobacter sp.]|nr:enoyl-CoA hydratase-related protein [Thermaerobacter sp.]
MPVEVKAGEIAQVLLNRPERRNALDAESLTQLAAAFDALGRDAQVRVIVLRGAGGHFCAGADLAEVAQADDMAARRDYFGGVAEAVRAMRRAPKPVIAEVEGYCLAGAMGLLAAADLAYAGEDAVFGLPEVQIGLFPMVVMAPLARLIGMRALTDLALTGRRATAKEALSFGLVNAVMPKAELRDTVAAKATQLASLSPFVLALGKEALWEVEDLPFEGALGYLRGMVAQVASSEDGKEGVRAFLEKRKPHFIGR